MVNKISPYLQYDTLPIKNDSIFHTIYSHGNRKVLLQGEN